MRGRIRLGSWRAFAADEVLHADRGFVWTARIGWMIRGYDALIDGTAATTWWLLGMVPLVSDPGMDITRSAIGRWIAESIWLPSMLLPSRGAIWSGSSVTLSRFGVSATQHLTLVGDRMREARMMRWGQPPGMAPGEYPFGCVIEEERTFDGITIPSQVRVGWHIGTPEWEKGEFFRASIDRADFA